MGVLLPDEFDVSLRDLPGERVVRNAEVERVELPPHSAVWRHIVMCIFNQPHHGPRIASALKPKQFRRSSCCRYFVGRTGPSDGQGVADTAQGGMARGIGTRPELPGRVLGAYRCFST